MSMLRLRQAAPTALLAVGLLALTACGATEYPNSTFNHHTDFNTDIDALWDRLLFWGTIVFVIVEALLILTIVKYRKREGGPAAKQIHGNAALEITWTIIPAVILVLIAVPTVKTIFKTQAPAAAGALKIEVIGHQWWWEFRYPELGIVTANELYLPVGRTANFELQTKDVLHSFWIPQMGGKRDLIANKKNYMWFTPNADLASSVWNGFCTEYCGSSHANMKFRLYTVQPAEFESWAKHQAKAAVFPAAAPAPESLSVASASLTPVTPVAQMVPAGDKPSDPLGYFFPKEQLPAHVIPKTPIPADLKFDDALLAQGDPQRGLELYSRSSCIGCHAIQGNPVSVAQVGPNLTHLATRHTIGGGLFVNDGPTLARWIKNAPKMKPGSIMNAQGKGEYDPQMKMTVAAGGLDDRQIADIVAYLMSLK